MHKDLDNLNIMALVKQNLIKLAKKKANKSRKSIKTKNELIKTKNFTRKTDQKKRNAYKEDKTYEMEKIEKVRCRLNKRTKEPIAEMLIKWKNFSVKSNTWEPIANYDRWNTVFYEYFSQHFKQRENEIYVFAANIKQRVKKRIRHDLNNLPKCLNMPSVFDPFVVIIYCFLIFRLKFNPRIEIRI